MLKGWSNLGFMENLVWFSQWFYGSGVNGTGWVYQVLNRPKNHLVNPSFQIYSDQIPIKVESKIIYDKTARAVESKLQERNR